MLSSMRRKPLLWLKLALLALGLAAWLTLGCTCQETGSNCTDVTPHEVNTPSAILVQPLP